MLYGLLKAAHVLGVVLWVGGMAFAHFFLRPALTALPPPQRLALMHEVLRRFLAAVLLAVALILASGAAMIGLAAGRALDAGGRFAWPADWLLMTVLGLVMVALFGHIRFVLHPRMGAALAAADWPAAAAALASIRREVTVNLALGTALSAAVIVL